MSTFVLERKIGETWIKLPNTVIGGDSSGVYPRIMDRFSGMVFENMKAGSYTIPFTEFQIPNGDIVGMSANIATTASIENSLKLCFGFFMLEDEYPFVNGEFRISSTIDNTDNSPLAAFRCSFLIENGIVKNYTWSNSGPPSNPMVVRQLNYEGASRCVPVLFAIQDTAEFNESYEIDDVTSEIANIYGIPAKWVVPIGNTVNKLIRFSVPANEFKMPSNVTAVEGEKVTLPSYNFLYNRNYIPLNWRIDNTTYPLGGSYTVPDHSVTAELVYDAKQYSGIVIL